MALILSFCHYYHDSRRVTRSTALKGQKAEVVSASHRRYYVVLQLALEGYPGQYHCLLSQHNTFLPGDQLRLRGRLTPSRYPGSLLGDVIVEGSPQLIGRPDPGPFVRLRRYLSQLIARGMSAEKAAMTSAIFLGDRSHYYVPARKKFQLTGTLHYLALSGLHLGLIILPFLLLFRLLRLTPRWQLVAVIPVLVVYLLVVGPIPSLIRAFVSFVLLTVAVFYEKRIDAVNGLCLVAGLCLCLDYSQVHSAGFYMTFAALGGIVLIGPRLLALLPCTGPHWLWQAIAYNSGAWLGIAPVLLLFFGELCPGALLLNLLLLPLFTVLLAACVLLPIWPGFFCWLIEKMWWVAEQLLDAALLYLRRPWGPSDSRLFAGVMLVFVLVLLVWKNMSRRSFSATVISLLLLVMFLPVSHVFVTPRARQLDVGQGSAYLIETAAGEATLVDCGSHSAAVGQKVIVPRLRKNGITHLPYIFVTHLDRDHWVGLEDVLARYPVGQVVLPAGTEGEAHGRMLALLARYRVSCQYMQRGDEIILSGTRIRCLHPGPDSPGEENDRSLVLLVERQKKLLFTGDIDDVGTPDLLRSNLLGKVHMLTAPHHGSLNAFMPLLIRQTRPEVIWLSSRQRFVKEPSILGFAALKKSWEGEVELDF